MQHKLRQLVISALMRNNRLNPNQFTVRVRGYHVQICGQVESPQQCQEILRTLSAVSPHLQIDNQLEVKPNDQLAQV